MIDKLEKQLTRHKVIEESLENRGLVAVVANVEEAIELANLYAPEHLCLVVKDAAAYVEKVENAGCLFVGENSLEVLVGPVTPAVVVYRVAGNEVVYTSYAIM